jgi:hypothetical protein
MMQMHYALVEKQRSGRQESDEGQAMRTGGQLVAASLRRGLRLVEKNHVTDCYASRP